jgi:hypothetical protein
MRPIHTLPLAVTRAIVSVEVGRRSLTVGDGTQEYVYKLKFHRQGADA